jgi:hypothetical protein
MSDASAKSGVPAKIILGVVMGLLAGVLPV